MRYLLSVILFLTMPSLLQAQQKLWQKIESTLIKINSKQNYDTLYLAKADHKWAIQLRTNVSGTSISCLSHYSDQTQDVHMEARKHVTQGVSVSYRGLSASLSFNPLKLSGKETDNQLNL